MLYPPGLCSIAAPSSAATLFEVHTVFFLMLFSSKVRFALLISESSSPPRLQLLRRNHHRTCVLIQLHSQFHQIPSQTHNQTPTGSAPFSFRATVHLRDLWLREVEREFLALWRGSRMRDILQSIVVECNKHFALNCEMKNGCGGKENVVLTSKSRTEPSRFEGLFKPLAPSVLRRAGQIRNHSFPEKKRENYSAATIHYIGGSTAPGDTLQIFGDRSG